MEQQGGFIPTPEPIPLPAPVWLLQALLFITFVVHLVPMNLTLGGLMFLAWGEWSHALDERLRQWVVRYLPITTAFTITTGIAPLLFLQVTYGQFFFPAAILIAWAWLLVIAALLLGYYGIYAYAWASDRLERWRCWVIVASTLLFLYIAFAFSNVITLMATPFRWWILWQETPSDRHFNLNWWEPTLLPRFAHFVLASAAFFGLTMALYGVAVVAKRDSDGAIAFHRTGVRWFVAPTLLNYFVGPLFLLLHEKSVWQKFVGADGVSTALLVVGIGLSIVGVIAAALSLRVRPLPMLLVAFGAMGGTIVMMAGVRFVLRQHLLALHAPQVRLSDVPVQPQWGIVVLFALLLVFGLGTVIWMVLQLQRAWGKMP
ncbi:hypothetical protein HRbin17_01115 [bacterium HR17]|uniref:Cytochrome bd menaquinol oxidase subunit I n=1 Tax=Candidatus Fervidibacter japonicus TaxID=2035412 RepID=A0A2H5XBN1_9BACT|nr:hypothetical protein HRbin17_01115 [bacterium HR17]